MNAGRFVTLLCLWLLWLPMAHAARVRAFLDRDHVHLGDTVTLNIQGDSALSGTPDLSPLRKDFEVLGTSRSSSVEIVNGETASTTQLGIALKPLHAGKLTIPPLDIGGSKTQALTVQVLAAPSGARGVPGDPAFLSANVGTSSPWVGQQIVYTVQLFYLPGVTDGMLDDPRADGARLIQLDRDRRYVAQRDGRTYQVIERSWALIPQRSGSITVRGPKFRARRLDPNDPNALFNNMFGGIGTPVQARAADIRIDARAAPAGAGSLWLPARSMKLQLTGLPQNGRVDAGVPLTLTLSIDASGVPADALPEPQLPPIAGARVYPDQTHDSTDDGGEWLKGSRTRSFAIVPERNGRLTIPEITLNWWDVVHDQAAQTSVPAYTLEVTGAASPAPASSANGPSAAPSTLAAPGIRTAHAEAQSADSAPWRAIALVSIALWLLAIIAAIVWWVRGRARRDGAPPVSEVTEPRADAKVLRQRALDAAHAGNAAGCERALLAWARSARPGIVTIGALREALSEATQCDALDALERARWQGGDVAPACAAVAQAFKRGCTWRAVEKRSRKSTPPDLPPLYPSS